MDPPRLRSDGGSLEARLLRSSPNLEPGPTAEDDLWRRLQVATVGVGISAAAGSATHAAASATGNVTAKALWLSALKWGAVAAVGLPAAGVATHVALKRWNAPASARELAVAVAPPVLPSSAPPAATVVPPVVEAPHSPAAAVATSTYVPRPTHRTDAALRNEATALRAESTLLASARAKLAAANYRGALDDVARLSAQFPQGKLAQEREVVAVDALAALGERLGARARALAFVQRFPDSPYAAHVRENAE